MELVGIIIGLIVLILLVIVHEAGHAIAARRAGVVVEEFGIGFPPRAWKKKLKNGTLFSLNWLPLGGFVKLQGEYDSARGKGDYGSASFWNKTRILFAGVVANLIAGVLLLTLLALLGMPKLLDNQFTVPQDSVYSHGPVQVLSLVSDHPAQKAGIETGDTITSFAGQDIKTPEQLINLSKQYKGKTVEVVYLRDSKSFSKNVTLESGPEGGYFGAALGQRETIRSTWSAPIVGVGTTVQFTALTIQGVGQTIYNAVSGFIAQFNFNQGVREQASQNLKAAGENVAGPVGILGQIFPTAVESGVSELVLLTAIISISLAVMNVLPVPALDGGRWFTLVVFRLRKKELTKEKEEKIQFIGFSILMGLVVLVTVLDVTRFF